MTFGLTDTGYIAPRSADFLTLIRDAFAAKLDALGSPLPDDYDFDADTFLGPITAVMADRLGVLAEAGQATFDGFDIANATGLQLDNLAVLVAITRNAATFSTSTVTLSGTAGTIITEGKLVEGGGTDGRARWATTANATIGGGGTVDVIVQAVDDGPVIAAPGVIDAIVTPVAGWDSVTNAADASPGTARESDADLRARRQASLQITGAANINAIRAAVFAIVGVQAAVVIENDQRVPAVVQGVSMPANSYRAVVFPDTITTAVQESVAAAIYDRGPAGIRSDGSDVVANVTGVDGFTRVIRFDFADEITVNVQTTVTVASGFTVGDVTSDVQQAVVDYFLSLGVGDAVRELALAARVSVVEGVVGASFLFNGNPADIVPTIIEIAILGTNTVV